MNTPPEGRTNDGEHENHMHLGDSTPHLGQSRAKAVIGLYGGLILVVVAALVLWPVIQKHGQPSLQRHAVVTNQTSAPIFVCTVDAAGDATATAKIEPAASSKVALVIGEGQEEVSTRTIHLLVLNDRGRELGRATFSGERAFFIESINVKATGPLEFLGFGGKGIEIGGKP